MRAVRLADSALEDIERQLPPDLAADFKRHDLRPVLEALSEHDELWEDASVPHGAARRLTIYGRTVAGFHLFGVGDTGDPREDAIVIYFIDIWSDEFPE
ncbi:MAG: hypothetical protein OEV40_28575 [Acidimicrobiia bacterium]|nr:hypothetical protein [Acidimicrobiia bacterium]